MSDSVRPTWDEFFMHQARDATTRSTCLRRQVGAVLARNNVFVSLGYNGAPRKLRHCAEVGCARTGVPSGQRHELCRGGHADANALLFAGADRAAGGILYISGGTPCSFCAKLIINAGVREVVYEGHYPDALALSMLEEAGIIIRSLEEP